LYPGTPGYIGLASLLEAGIASWRRHDAGVHMHSSPRRTASTICLEFVSPWLRDKLWGIDTVPFR